MTPNPAPTAAEAPPSAARPPAWEGPGPGESLALAALEDRLGHRFSQGTLLDLALTHPSITHDQGVGTPHNQRLEFLGDAVLQLVLTLELYEKFPALGEGPLTQARAEMVNRRSLALQSRALGVGEFLRVSRSEESTGGRDRDSALADAFEAVVGAIFLDAGLEAVRSFILRRFREAFGPLEELPSLHNPKGELQELLQAESAEGPSYHLLAATGPDHDRVFESAVSFRGDELGRGQGKTKKAAETEAARAALRVLRRRTPGSPASSGADAGDSPPSEPVPGERPEGTSTPAVRDVAGPVTGGDGVTGPRR